MNDATTILSRLKSLSSRTTEVIRLNEIILSKNTALALGSDMKTFDDNKKRNIYIAIGITSMRILQMKALLKSQNDNTRKVRITEFLAVPLTIIKRLLGITNKSYRDAGE